MMTPGSPQAVQVKAELDSLIDSASSKQFGILDTIYHKDMGIYLLDSNYELHRMIKPNFIEHVTIATETTEKPNKWARYHLAEADETQGHVLISRKVNLTGKEQTDTLSIDSVREDDRWQITREVTFACKM